MSQVIELIRGLGVGGAEALLVTRLRFDRDRAAESIVVNTYPGQDHHMAALREAGIEVRTCGGNPVRVATSIVRQFRAAPRGTVFVSHSPSTGVILKGCRALRLRRDMTVVDVVHNSSFRWFYRVLGRVLNRYAHAAVLVGSEVAASPTAVGYRRAVMVHGGVDRKHFLEWKARHPEVREELEAMFDGEVRTIGITVGGLTTVKQQAVGIEAVALMGPDHGLLVLGTGPEEDNLRALAGRSGARVHFAGQVPDAWKLIAWSDALVHTSKYEGLPVVLMEAAAVGTPIVASPFEGAHEVASTGVNVNLAATSRPEAVAEAWSRASAAPAPGTEDAGAYWDVRRFADEFYAVVDGARSSKEKSRG